MRRGFSSLGCAELSFAETLALAARHQLDAVELRALGGSLDLAAYFQNTFGSPAALAAQPRPPGVSVVALNASLHLLGATPAERAELTALAPWAEALGARWLRVFDGGTPGNPAGFAAAQDTLGWWQALRAREGWRVDLAVETHDSLFTADALRAFLAAVPGVAVLWDSHHTWRKGGEDPAVTWRAIRAAVVHVHVKDSIDVPSARHPFTYVLPGDGGFPIATVLSALAADSYAGVVSLEWERHWHPYLPLLEEALATARARRWW